MIYLMRRLFTTYVVYLCFINVATAEIVAVENFLMKFFSFIGIAVGW